MLDHPIGALQVQARTFCQSAPVSINRRNLIDWTQTRSTILTELSHLVSIKQINICKKIYSTRIAFIFNLSWKFDLFSGGAICITWFLMQITYALFVIRDWIQLLFAVLCHWSTVWLFWRVSSRSRWSHKLRVQISTNGWIFN